VVGNAASVSDVVREWVASRAPSELLLPFELPDRLDSSAVVERLASFDRDRLERVESRAASELPVPPFERFEPVLRVPRERVESRAESELLEPLDALLDETLAALPAELPPLPEPPERVESRAASELRAPPDERELPPVALVLVMAVSPCRSKSEIAPRARHAPSGWTPMASVRRTP